MAERTEYPAGTPSWVDLGSPNAEEAAAFYGGLFGWTATMDPRPEAGGYGMFTLRGKNVAGLGPQMNPDHPPFWNVYVTVDDAAATLASAKASGGEAVMGPMEMFDAGTMGVIKDSVGSFMSIWQPAEHPGAELVNEPGTFGWNELATTDIAAAQDFYTSVFGWGVSDDAGSDTATIFTVDGRIVCGAHVAGEGEFPAWSVWFGAEDCDAAVAKASELGGKVLMPPNDMDFGRGAVVADPHGAAFGIASPKSEVVDAAS